MPKVLPFSGMGFRICLSFSAFLYTANKPHLYLNSEAFASKSCKEWTSSQRLNSCSNFSREHITLAGFTDGHVSLGNLKCLGFRNPAFRRGSEINLLALKLGLCENFKRLGSSSTALKLLGGLHVTFKSPCACCPPSSGGSVHFRGLLYGSKFV